MKKVLLLTVALLSLYGCLIPDKFTMVIDIGTDGSYAINYEGTMMFGLFLGSRPSDRDIEAVKHDILRDHRFKSAEYAGNGRYKVSYVDKGKLTSPVYFIGQEMTNFVTIIPRSQDKDKLVTIVSSLDFSQSRQGEIKEIVDSIDGILIVRTKGKVLDHNAETTPRFFGLFGDYTWHIKKGFKAPSMLINIPNR